MIISKREQQESHSHIINKLSCSHDADDKKPMDAQRIDGQGGMVPSKPVKVDICHNKAGVAAIGVLNDPL